MTSSSGTSNLSEVCGGCTKIINNNCPYYASTSIWQRMGGCPFNREMKTDETKVRIGQQKQRKKR